MGGSTSGRRCGPARQRLDSLAGSGARFERPKRRQGRVRRFEASIRFALDGLALGRRRRRADFPGCGAALAFPNIRAWLGGFGVVAPKRLRWCGFAGRGFRVGGAALDGRSFRTGLYGLADGAFGAVAQRRRPFCGLAGRRLGVGGVALADRRFGVGCLRVDLGALAVGARGAVAQERRLGAGSRSGGDDDHSICVGRRFSGLACEEVAGRQQSDHDRTGDAQEKRMQRIITHFGGVFA